MSQGNSAQVQSAGRSDGHESQMGGGETDKRCKGGCLSLQSKEPETEKEKKIAKSNNGGLSRTVSYQGAVRTPRESSQTSVTEAEGWLNTQHETEGKPKTFTARKLLGEDATTGEKNAVY